MHFFNVGAITVHCFNVITQYYKTIIKHKYLLKKAIIGKFNTDYECGLKHVIFNVIFDQRIMYILKL